MNQYIQAPHIEGHSRAPVDAPNAALLIDFDNVTMGMRSDLSKELKSLLQSDIIRGKVTVQRAYADWRRYPQYIVPLSEASVDLIFAPAYGSSKKNATDIRMAIDGVELVFTRPEIGTFILRRVLLVHEPHRASKDNRDLRQDQRPVGSRRQGGEPHDHAGRRHAIRPPQAGDVGARRQVQ